MLKEIFANQNKDKDRYKVNNKAALTILRYFSKTDPAMKSAEVLVLKTCLFGCARIKIQT